jgi:hypothetical protein
MFLRLILSAGLMCGLAAASEQPLQVLNTTPRTMQACTQLALQNAVNPARQKKLAQQNVIAGGINYPYMLGHDHQKLDTKTIISAQNQPPGGCAIPLTLNCARFRLRRPTSMP